MRERLYYCFDPSGIASVDQEKSLVIPRKRARIAVYFVAGRAPRKPLGFECLKPGAAGLVGTRAWIMGSWATPWATQLAYDPSTRFANMSNLPPGWYPDQADARFVRWWDGEHWTQHVNPAQQPSVTQASNVRTPATSNTSPAQLSASTRPLGPMRRRSVSAWYVTGCVVLAVLLVTIGFGVVNALSGSSRTAMEGPAIGSSESPKPTAAVEASATPKPTKTTPPKPQKSAAQTVDDEMIADGWSVIKSGRLYGKFADKGDYTCGAYDCVGYHAVSMDGCPTALYIEANVESDGAVVGMANKLFGSTKPGQTASAVLEDYADMGDSFRVTKVECY